MENLSPVEAAVLAWKQNLGADAVIDDSLSLETYTRSVCATTRQVVAVLKPCSLEEVQKIVATANAHKVPIYPISCGKQWGMGSRLPVQDGAAILDLSGMNRIIEVSGQYHYAVVEPGVTQRQLVDYIEEHNLPLMLNVTGSSSDTSLIGNAMDRGVGYFDSRAHGFSNLQVVLGNGETIRTGFGHYEKAKTKNLYNHGVGPSLDGLFPQANFGIVTSACIDLMPMPEHRMTAALTIDSEEKLPLLIDALVMLRTKGFIKTIAHVGNRERSHITFAPLIYEQMIDAGDLSGSDLRKKVEKILADSDFGPWTAGIGVLGTKKQLKLAKKEIRCAVRGFAKVTFLDDVFIFFAKSIAKYLSFIPYVRTQKMLLSAIGPVCGFTQGKTTDTSLKTVYWPAGDYDNLNAPDPDRTNSGVLFCLPIIPANGKIVLEVVNDTRDTFARHGFEAAITVNLMNSKSMEGVVSLAFDRRDKAQTTAAHACIQEMEARYMSQGYPPYRVGINSMHHVVQEDDSFWRIVRDLKSVLDPNNIISPGRYNLV